MLFRQLKLASWNVNGIRACQKQGFLDWVNAERPHILLLQEVRAWPEQLDASLREMTNYTSYFFSAQKKGHSGLALYLHNSLRSIPMRIIKGLGTDYFDWEGRTLILELDNYVIINGYYPNGQRDLNRVPFKLEFSYAMLEMAQRYRLAQQHVILCGDFNTAHHPIDLANPKQNEQTTGFLLEERAFLDELEHQQFVMLSVTFTLAKKVIILGGHIGIIAVNVILDGASIIFLPISHCSPN